MAIRRRAFITLLLALGLFPNVSFGAGEASSAMLLARIQGMGVGYSAAATALFARFTTPPTTARKALINTLIVTLENAGIWAKLDLFYMMAAADAQAAQRNWLSDTFNLSEVSSPSFTADQGYASNGTSSYVTTGWDPATNGIFFTQNDASIGVWSLTNAQNANGLFGSGTSQANYLVPRNTSDDFYWRINVTAATFPNVGVIGDARGLFSASRTGAAVTNAYRNGGLAYSADTVASAALSNVDFNIGRTNSMFSTQRAAFAFVGGSLTAADSATLYAAVATYLVGVGISIDAPWLNSLANPIVGNADGVFFDPCVILDGSTYKMWVAWRTNNNIAYLTSSDGISWSSPTGVLSAIAGETLVKTPVVVKLGSTYYMWFSGQSASAVWTNYATSPDGITWTRITNHCLDGTAAAWDSKWAAAGAVVWDAANSLWRMWYSGGAADLAEPESVGYATSPDGSTWTKYVSNPIFSATGSGWEGYRVAVGSVQIIGGVVYMWYIGYADINTASIGLAKSSDGLTSWVRKTTNPILISVPNTWTRTAVYKASVIPVGSNYALWYNGRNNAVEQIGQATHGGADLGL